MEAIMKKLSRQHEERTRIIEEYNSPHNQKKGTIISKPPRPNRSIQPKADYLDSPSALETGNVYMCGSVPYNNKVKIGRTTESCATSRLSQLQCGNPDKLKMLFVSNSISCYKIYEKNLHIAYKDKHINGEWFNLEEWEVDYLANMMMEDEEFLGEYMSDFNNEQINNVLEGIKDYDQER
tara:strand:- start:52 stop:591 length:540 start_codon:yes stop_codon:yes gene_type:complete